MSTMYVNNIAPLEGNTINVASGTTLYAPGSVVQVVQETQATGVTTTTAETYTDTNLSASITPSSTSSKILVTVSQPCRVARNSTYLNLLSLRLMRDTTGVFTISPGYDLGLVVPTAASVNEASFVVPLTYLDSPSTTSQITYKTQFALRNNTGSASANTIFDQASTSTITLMEIAG
jgi:hypothetical protein